VSKSKITTILVLTTIFLIGLFLRLYRLNLNTPPLYADETGHYFVLRSIITRSSNFIEYLISISFSFTWFLGLSPLGVRLASAVYGSLLVIVVYFLGNRFSGGNKKVSLTYSALVAVLPWSYMLSRLGHTHIQIILLLICLHTLFYLRSKQISEYLISLVPLGIAAVYYPAVLFILPFILMSLFFTVYRLIDKKHRRLYLLFFVILTISFGSFVSIRTKIFSSSGRGLQLAIWRDVNTTHETDQYRALSWNSSPTLFSFFLPPEQLANKLVYNRAIANLTTFEHNYFSFFSPDWLFLKGDTILRHSTGQVGAFYPFLIPFMLYGAFVFFKTTNKKIGWVFSLWILASPAAAAITNDGAGYLLRVVTMLPFLTYFCALGLVESFNLIKKNWRIPYGLLLSLVGFYSAYYFFFGYFHVYPALSARSYEYGFKELSDFQVAHNNAPMLVIWDGYYHNNDFRFWQKTPFDQNAPLQMKRLEIGTSVFWQTFPNLYFSAPKTDKDVKLFIRQNPVSFLVLPDRYFLNYPVELDKDFASPSAVIKYPDQTTALTIYKIN